ncbi:diguanylate cyclase domain-containing protein [Mangrovicella endophytica]|uniref:diguanylate cyclase domain-containing protein n=1 Tax=Mangrovicella endophytica TaxID=2066697 RepID=UPI0018E4C7AD|nr:diguanylate cyclase [Mangrovicella endophytica]
MPNRSYLPDPSRWLAVAVPAGLAIALIGGLACMLLAMSVREANELVVQRDRSLAASILQQAVQSIAHNQESVTAWDEAVTHLQGPLDPEWIDDNMGLWMNMYFGFERLVVLDPQDRPVYASQGDSRADPSTFQDLEPTARSMIADVRQALASGKWQSPDSRIRSPGAQDIAVIDGHPAVVSVKPVVPSTGKIRQRPADAYIHLAVHYLDGRFLEELEHRYLFEGARFSWDDRPGGDELSFALRDNQGRPVGFLLWKVHLPGQVLAERMAPALVATLCAMLIVVAVLVASLRKGARALRASEARARHLAFHDTLTGLPNRARFNEQLDAAFRSGDGDIRLLLLDLDRFKQVNDTLGHPAGDALIRAVGERLCQAAPAGATVARLGGDEFAILLPPAPEAEGVQLCRTLIAAIEAPFPLQDAVVKVGASIGVASMCDAASPDDLVRHADQALYRAKRSGGGIAQAGGDGVMPAVERSITKDRRAPAHGTDHRALEHHPHLAAALRQAR